MSTPYTYIIKFIPDGRVYYGVRYKNGCHPDDLLRTYFTSSKEVKQLIKEHGVSSFEKQIRRTFDSKKKAVAWETKVLIRTNAIYRNVFINKTNNVFMSPLEKHTEESKRKIGLAHKGKTVSEETKEKLRKKAKERYKNKEDHPRYGKKHTEETKKKFSKIHKNKTISEEQKRKQSEFSKRTKSHENFSKWRYRCTWLITYPNGDITITNNLRGFCRENNLSSSAMCSVNAGRQTHHKQFTCKKVHESTDFKY